MKKTVLIFLCIIFVQITKANNINDAYNSANNLYKNKQYDSALTIYQSLLQQGVYQSDVYYNLGNVYFKKKQISKAILNYERAKKINPDDEDINFNLEVANTKLVDKIEPLPLIFYKRWWNNTSELFTISAWSRIAIICTFLFSISIAVFFITKLVFIKKMLFYNSILMLLVVILSILLANYKSNSINNNNYAIIMPISLTVKSSPDAKSTDIFIVHEGLKVEVIDNIEDWSEIKLANGEKGWVKNTSFEKI